jgi:DNA-binding IclR family transcriptional regulator
MSQWPEKETDRYLSRPLEAYTQGTVVDPAAIKERLGTTRELGHCWVYEEFAEGINSVAAPVLADGRGALGAIHVHGPAYRFPSDGPADAISSLVMEAAHRFSARTGHS